MIEEINLLKNKFYTIKNLGWVKSLRKGSTGIGYTFESLLGKKEDTLTLPDFNGIEIKSHRKNSKSYITLFNYNPIGESSYELKRIFKKFGYHSTKYQNSKVLHANIYCKYVSYVGIDYKFSLHVDDNKRRVYLLVFDRFGNFLEKKSYWVFDILKDKLYAKMQYLAYVEASSKYINGYEFFKYEKIKFYKLRNFESFIELLKIAKIKVSFLVSGSIDGNDDLINSHGTSFSIKSDNLDLLYEPID